MRDRITSVLVLTVAAWLVVIPSAGAYIDAGSVSVVFQAVVAGLAASWMFVKLFWRRIVAYFRRDSDETPVDAGVEGR